MDKHTNKKIPKLNNVITNWADKLYNWRKERTIKWSINKCKEATWFFCFLRIFVVY